MLKWSARRRIKRGGDALSSSTDAPALPHMGGAAGGLLAGGGGEVTTVQVLVPASRNRGTGVEKASIE